MQEPRGKRSAHPQEPFDLQHCTKYGMHTFVHDEALHDDPPLLLPPLLPDGGAAHAFD